MEITVGSRLGRYEVRATLGAGGMGEVFVARDTELERDVAVKILREEAPSSDRVRRFVQEAKAASALNHPNVAHVYEIGSEGALRFIAMELVGGETLRDRLGRGPIPIDDVLHIATQIASGLAAAHGAGIVHRDVKPENLIIRPDGYVKILDFGLAKLRQSPSEESATILKTRPGVTMGTLSYMAPEQLSGEDVTAAADVFSLGVVLYEMLAGKRPFTGADATEVATSILSRRPPPLHGQRRDIPPKLESVVAKCLAKEVKERYPSGAELAEELRQISREEMGAVAPDGARRSSALQPRRVWWIAAALLLVAVIGGVTWMQVDARRERRALAMLAAAERHLETRAYPQAYEAAVAAATLLPQNDRLRDVIRLSSEKATIESDPPGARVSMRRMDWGEEEARPAGTTPLVIPQLPHGEYIVTIEKEGYAPFSRALSTTPLVVRDVPMPQQPVTIRVRLVPAADVDPGMVQVGGGEYRLAGWTRPSDEVVELDDFLIDRHEVSNRDFEEFVSAGGYRKRELWRHPFVDGRRTLSFDEAMARFRDATSMPGPRNWTHGAPPPGREDHPVTDITWYEAAAFAEWKGKRLPTIYQWEKAGRAPGVSPAAMTFPWGFAGAGVDLSWRTNFSGKGTVPVDSMPFGMSTWGAHHMAGNVAEWCRNAKPPGYTVRGGGWNDALYAFGATGAYPAFYSSPALGFRCVKELRRGGGDQGGFALAAEERAPEFHPVDDRTFEEIRRRYDYVKEPLAATVVEVSEAPAWRKEKIVYEVRGKSVPAYLYTPKSVAPPYQVIHFSPAGDVVSGFRPLDVSIEAWLGAAIRSGRAAFAVVMEGYTGRPRPPDAVRPDSASAAYADTAIAQVTEQRRGLDYLESRRDIDASKIAFVAPSAGSVEGVLLTGVEHRYRSVMFIGSSVRQREMSTTPAANRINFAPRIRGPKLMLHGRYDETGPLKTEAEPLFRLLSEPKRLDVYDGGHAPPYEVVIPAIQNWLDETLGPVR